MTRSAKFEIHRSLGPSLKSDVLGRVFQSTRPRYANLWSVKSLDTYLFYLSKKITNREPATTLGNEGWSIYIRKSGANEIPGNGHLVDDAKRLTPRSWLPSFKPYKLGSDTNTLRGQRESRGSNTGREQG